MRKMNLIVAMDTEGGIGKNGGLPWRIKKDMQHFAAVTKKVNYPSKRNAVLMGRKCWESIPESRRPLAGRLNIVLSRQLTEHTSENLIIAKSFESVSKLLAEPQYCDSIETIWNIGGAEIYDIALRDDLVEEIYLTRIFKNFDADVYLKSLDFGNMEKVEPSENLSENSETFEENGIRFEFSKWRIITSH
uniref:dihydrofolate reductase n=1 Tax=Caenorhabditis tropicalis TaxID=1561998 RepID=A0A1I7UY72_9PELO